MQFSRLASIVVDVTFVLASGATPIAWKTELKHTMPAAGTDGLAIDIMKNPRSASTRSHLEKSVYEPVDAPSEPQPASVLLADAPVNDRNYNY